MAQEMQPSVEYLGYTLDADGLHPTAKKVAAICRAPQPHKVTTLKSYLGLLSYYSRSLPHLPTTLNPLYTLLQKNVLWVWTHKEREAFEASKKSLTTGNILAHYDPKKKLLTVLELYYPISWSKGQRNQ